MLCSSTILTAPVMCHTLPKTFSTHMPPELMVPSKQGLQLWCPNGLRLSNSFLSFDISQAFFSLLLFFSTGRSTSICHYLSQPFHSQVHCPTTITFPTGLRSVLCLLKSSTPLSHDAWIWGGNIFPHCPLQCYRRLQTPLIKLCPICSTQTGCLSYSPSRKKPNISKHLLTWSNKHIFFRGRKSIRMVTKFEGFFG